MGVSDLKITMAEIWKPVVGFEGYYEVSNLGRVRTDPGAKGISWHYHAGKILRQHDSDRYFRVALCGPRKIFRTVHTLVLYAFIGPRPRGKVCRHIDGNAYNNVASNLKWGTQQQNIDDKQKHGTQTRGSKHGTSKITEADVIEIRKLRATGLTFRELATRFPIGADALCCITNRKTWKHVP